MAVATALLAGILWVQLAERVDRTAKENAAQAEAAAVAKRQAAIDHYNSLSATVYNAARLTQVISDGYKAGSYGAAKRDELLATLQTSVSNAQVELATYPANFPANLK